jgi:RecB family exonuclease
MTKVWVGETLKVSNSEIQTFKDCRRKWWFVYYRELGLKRDRQEVTGPRSLGTRVHKALEGMYTLDRNPIETLKEIYEMDIEQIREHRGEPAAEALQKEYALAHIMIEGYLQWATENAIDDGLELVEAEGVVEVKSSVENVLLRAKMDQRIVRKSDGARLFRDFKTVANLTDPPKILPMDEQMKFYQLLEYLQSIEATGSEPQWRTDGALYTMLRKVKRTAAAKPPFYDQLEVHHNITEIRNMWKRVAKVVEEIVDARVALDSGEDHQYQVPPRPSRDCTWKCDFFAVCSMVDDGSDVEGMIGEFYEHLDPHERYNVEEAKGEN